ncbi:MAG TPA: TraB/GumN family protein, partial [Chitinophagaceae bacterium]|nr:TraB/GumN family protein [Chitinophagaceae bacterium]
MKPLVIIAAFALVIALPANAQKKSSLLWEISGKDFKQPSYLFGTFHAMCKTDFDFHDSIKAKLSKTNL